MFLELFLGEFLIVFMDKFKSKFEVGLVLLLLIVIELLR